MKYKVRNPKKNEMRELFAKFRKYGDVPEDEYRKVRRTSKRKQWLVVVDNNNTILGGGRTYKKDWYEWVVKNAFVIPKARGKGLANILYAKLTDKAEAEGAYVAEADITSTNIPSKMGAVYAGMQPVNVFRWSRKRKDKPADVYQEVFIKPTNKEISDINRYIRRELKERKKMVATDVLTTSPFYKKRR